MTTCNNCGCKNTCDMKLILLAKGFSEDTAYCCAAKPHINHTNKGSKKRFYKIDRNGNGYYAIVEGDRIELGESWPHEGGIYWSGSYQEFLTKCGNFKKDCEHVYNQIVKHFEKL